MILCTLANLTYVKTLNIYIFNKKRHLLFIWIFSYQEVENLKNQNKLNFIKNIGFNIIFSYVFNIIKYNINI